MNELKNVIKEYDSYENDNYRIGAMAQTIIGLRQKLEKINYKTVFHNLKKYDVCSLGFAYEADSVEDLLNEIANLSICAENIKANEYRFLG